VRVYGRTVRRMPSLQSGAGQCLSVIPTRLHSPRKCQTAGVLFDGMELRPPPVHHLRLAGLEPMWMPHVWSAVRDALLSASAGSSTNKVGVHPC